MSPSFSCSAPTSGWPFGSGVHASRKSKILTKQTSPSVNWLERARENLVKLYTVSQQPEKAKRFQAELDASLSG